MTSKSESALQKECLRWAKSLPKSWALKVVGSGVQSSGVPDIIMCIKGYFIAIELKRPDGKGKLSDIQKAQMERIRKAGGRAVMVSSFEEFKKIIGEYYDNGDN